jgi:retron-type reverse transcriptase
LKPLCSAAFSAQRSLERNADSAHQAVAQAQRYIAAGHNVVVDLDLEKFFDRVNHDSLMARVAARGSDKRVLKLPAFALGRSFCRRPLTSNLDPPFAA